MNSLAHLKHDCDIFIVTISNNLRAKALDIKTNKALLCSNAVILGKIFTKIKAHGLPDALSEEFLFKCLSAMIYDQFPLSSYLCCHGNQYHYIIFIT